MTAIGPYEVVGEIARGGMGVVYRARDPQLGRDVAVKVLLTAGTAEAERVRFAEEARALARLRHPAIVGIQSAGVAAGHPYLVLDLVEGRSLADRLREEGPLPEVEAASLTLRLAEALEYAHGRGVLHRDVKPSNVLLDPDGRPLLTDFGLARILGRDARLTATGEVLGTPGFMSPEQARADGSAGVAADVYGLGATLYAALTGRAPFEGGSVLAILNDVATREPVSPSGLRPGLDPALEAICIRCLHKDPAQRYPDARSLGAALRDVVQAPAAPVGGGGRRAAALALVAATAGGLVGWLGATLATPAPPAAPAPPPATELLVELGRALLRDSRPEAAREAFTRALQLDPDDVTALAGRGRARGLLGDGRGEADDCARALELDPRSEAALLGLGRGLCAQGDHRGAVERYGQAADLGGDVALALGRRAECWLHLSDPERAEADATRAGELSPGDTLPLTVLGRVFYESGRYSEALAVYRRWQKIAPADLDAVQGRAAALLALGKRDEAGVAVDRLLEQDPQRSAGYVIRAQLHDEGGRPWAALEDATRGLLVARDPGHRQILYSRRAALRGRMGDKEGALRDCDEGLVIGPSAALFQNRANIIYAADGDLEEALADYGRAIEVEPDRGDAWLMQGKLLTNLNRNEAALESLDRAVKLLPNLAKARVFRGVVQIRLGKFARARADLTAACEIDPRDPEAWYYRATLLQRGRDYRGALECIERARALVPPDHPQAAVFDEVYRTLQAQVSGPPPRPPPGTGFPPPPTPPGFPPPR